jgi:hypothetical protein
LLGGQDVFDGDCVVGSEVGVLVELGFQALHFFEVLDEGGAGVVALEALHGLRREGSYFRPCSLPMKPYSICSSLTT